MDTAEEKAELGNVIVLKHPSGSQLFVVGTAHVSEKAQQDAKETIERVQPAVVVLEIDEDRMRKLVAAAESGDRYNFQVGKATGGGWWQLLGLAVTGELLPYAMGLVFVATGALMGTRPGGEFLAARDAAEEESGVGARVVLADRSVAVTMRRLLWYTQQLRPEPSWPREQGRAGRERGGVSDRDPGALPDFMRREPRPEAEQARAEVRADVEASVRGGADPWGLSTDDDDDSEHAMRERLLRMMREGGCPQPNAVLHAAQRLLRSGLDPKGAISPADVLTVRECGRTLVENFRRRAMAGDDAWLQRLEVEGVAGAGGSVGAQRSALAMRKVIVEERDLILARRLWEAGEQAGPLPVVGVVGAGHVRGIQRYWERAGSEEAGRRAEEFMSLPPGEGSPSLVGPLIAGGVFGYIAWRRPRAAAFVVAAVTLTTAPYLGFAVFSMKRLTAFTSKLVGACERIEESGGGMDGAGAAWPQEGQEWQ